MINQSDLWEQDATELGPTSSELSNIARLAGEMEERRKVVDKIEKELKAAQAALREIEEVRLPQAILDTGVTSVGFASGQKLEVKEDIKMSIPKKNKQLCAKWLKENGAESLVRETATLPVEEAILDMLDKAGVEYAVDETIPTGSVKALFRELMKQAEEEGRTLELPMKDFGAFQYRKAVLK